MAKISFHREAEQTLLKRFRGRWTAVAADPENESSQVSACRK
jgi:hypothetical protein